MTLEPPTEALEHVDLEPAASAPPPEASPPSWTPPPSEAPSPPWTSPLTPDVARPEAEVRMVAPILTSRPARSKSRSGSAWSAWVLTILFTLAVLSGILVVARNQIVEAVPAARGVYQALGLPVLSSR